METDEKACPVCGETIKTVALKCRFCNTDLTSFANAKELEAEKDLFSGHPAVLYSAGQLLPFLLALAIAAAVGYYMGSEAHSNIGIVYTVLGFVFCCCVVYAYFYANSRATHYEITTQRIKYERGILSKTEESLDLFRVDHFELRKPLGMRVLGQAALHLFSSDAELDRFYVYGVPKLETLAETLRECQLRERQRRGLTTFVRA
jgi:membrane protein YdbS with pleckstrin-like domain